MLWETPELPELTANLQQPEIRAPSFDGSRLRRSAVHFGQSSPIEPEARVATTKRGRAVSSCCQHRIQLLCQSPLLPNSCYSVSKTTDLQSPKQRACISGNVLAFQAGSPQRDTDICIGRSKRMPWLEQWKALSAGSRLVNALKRTCCDRWIQLQVGDENPLPNVLYDAEGFWQSLVCRMRQFNFLLGPSCISYVVRMIQDRARQWNRILCVGV